MYAVAFTKDGRRMITGGGHAPSNSTGSDTTTPQSLVRIWSVTAVTKTKPAP